MSKIRSVIFVSHLTAGLASGQDMIIEFKRTWMAWLFGKPAKILVYSMPKPGGIWTRFDWILDLSVPIDTATLGLVASWCAVSRSSIFHKVRYE